MAAVTKVVNGDLETYSMTLTTADHTGDWIDVPYRWFAAFIEAITAAAGGATLAIEGAVGTQNAALGNVAGTAITFTASGGKSVAEWAPRIRARLSTVGTAATWTVNIAVNKRQT